MQEILGPCEALHALRLMGEKPFPPGEGGVARNLGIYHEEALEREIERLIHAVRALEFRVSLQEGAIKGMAGRIQALESR